MKTAIYQIITRNARPFPNALSRREILHKFLDLLIMAATGAAAAAGLLLLLAL